MPGGIGAVLSRAQEHGVTGCITVSTTTHNALDCLAVAKSFDRVWSSAGVHPLYSDEGPHEWAKMKIAASDPKCVAWGELGLDNHYKEPLAATQRQVLEEQLTFIESCTRDGISKPIIIHCREAFDDLIPILAATSLPRNRFVFHCFTGTTHNARQILDFGAHISFTGVVTYKNAAEVQAAACLVPADRIMVETDAPFLAPNPHRSVRPCEPWMTSLTARFIAQLRGVPWDDFHAQLNRNTQAFFGIDAR